MTGCWSCKRRRANETSSHERPDLAPALQLSQIASNLLLNHLDLTPTDRALSQALSELAHNRIVPLPALALCSQPLLMLAHASVPLPLVQSAPQPHLFAPPDGNFGPLTVMEDGVCPRELPKRGRCVRARGRNDDLRRADLLAGVARSGLERAVVGWGRARRGWQGVRVD